MENNEALNYENFVELDNDDVDVRDVIKIVFLGDSGVGKTNIMNRFASDNFNINSKPTIGVDFAIKTVKINNHVVRLQLWDTAGQERYRTFTTAYFKDSHGIIMVYDVSNRESFINMSKWFKTAQDHVDFEKVTCILVGNKIDLQERVVSTQEGEDLAKSKKVLFMETSALDNREECVKRAFFVLLNQIIKHYEFESLSPKFNGDDIDFHVKKNKTIDENLNEKKKTCC